MPTEKPYWANNYCTIFVRTAHSRAYLANQNLGYTIGKISINGRTRVLSNHLSVENTWVKIRNVEIVCIVVALDTWNSTSALYMHIINRH